MMAMAAMVWVGLDDTDSRRGGCTTYLAALLVRKLEAMGYRLAGYPRLIRLNPNCPFKTRGNAAVALAVVNGDPERVEEVVRRVIDENAELNEEGTDPGAAIYLGAPPLELREFYLRALHEIISLEEALKMGERIGARLLRWKLGRGVIGALAAIGADLSRAKTYELIAHRRREFWGTIRQVDARSVWEMDAATRPLTFDNVDPETGEVRITPHTPCPVLLGIRGVTPEVVEEAYRMLRINEPVEFYTIFETNQGTDAHLRAMKVGGLRDGVSAIVDGVVASKPRYEIGGHVFFRLSDETGEVTCAAYEPTKSFRHIVAKLRPGDRITVYGAVKLKPQGLTLNLEKIHIKELARIVRKRPPLCPSCGRRMESAGRGKGFRCRRCKTRSMEAEIVEVGRDVRPGLYEVPPSARRHLARPLTLPRDY